MDNDFLRIFAKGAFLSFPRQLRIIQRISTMNNTKVDIMVSTADDQFSAKTAFNLIQILNEMGIETNYPLQQTSCGKELYETGDYNGAKELGEKTMRQFSGKQSVVCTSSAWVAYMRRVFPKMYFNTAFHIENQEFCKRIHDITDFLVNICGTTCVNNSFPHRVLFVDNCQTLNDYPLHDEPRVLLRNTQGLELVDTTPEFESTCCGFGSLSFASDFEPVSTELARRKVEFAINAEAEVITSTDTACLLHLQSYINRKKLDLQCVHIIDILASKNA